MVRRLSAPSRAAEGHNQLLHCSVVVRSPRPSRRPPELRFGAPRVGVSRPAPASPSPRSGRGFVPYERGQHIEHREDRRAARDPSDRVDAPASTEHHRRRSALRSRRQPRRSAYQWTVREAGLRRQGRGRLHRPLVRRRHTGPDADLPATGDPARKISAGFKRTVGVARPSRSITPGREFSTNTSATAARRATSDRPSGASHDRHAALPTRLRYSTDIPPQTGCRARPQSGRPKGAKRRLCFHHRRTIRPRSPPRPSTRERTSTQLGPATNRVTSTTRTPASGSSLTRRLRAE